MSGIFDDPPSAEGKEALDSLFAAAQRFSESREYLKLLKFVRRFPRYSAYNAMLVYTQMPGARYVLTAVRWREYGRRPVRDAQPLVMLQPMGPVMFGFDVSQTEGDPLPEGFANPFRPRDSLDAKVFDRLVARAHRAGIDVRLKPLGSTLGGYVRSAAEPDHAVAVVRKPPGVELIAVRDKWVPMIAEVTLNANLDAATNFSTLTHELGHLYCGHLGAVEPVKKWPERMGLSRQVEEFEAESVSYLVCRRIGLKTRADEYLNGYLGSNARIPEISPDRVLKAANQIERL